MAHPPPIQHLHGFYGDVPPFQFRLSLFELLLHALQILQQTVARKPTCAVLQNQICFFLLAANMSTPQLITI
jgi:hypothetical protein